MNIPDLGEWLAPQADLSAEELMDRDMPKERMSISDRAVEIVSELGHATALQVYARMKDDGYSRRQVASALSNAVTIARRLVTTRHALRDGAHQAIYRLAPSEADYLFKPNRKAKPGPQYASVFHYAQGIAANDNRRTA